MGMADVAALASAIAAGASAVAAWLSWRSERKAFILQGTLSQDAIKAAAFEQRFRVYSDVQQFMSAWGRNGVPDIGQLPGLLGAWDRSRFLFQPDVTHFIRTIWKDATAVCHAAEVIGGIADGDRGAAVKLKNERFRYYFDEHGDLPYNGVFYQAFARDLSIVPPLAPYSIEKNDA